MPPSTRDSSIPADPLTTALQICIVPFFYAILFIVHLFYYIYRKTISSIRWQRRIFLEIKDRPNTLWQGWLDGLGVKQAGLKTAQQASEERLLERGNVVRTQGRFLTMRCKGDSLKMSKKQRPIAPRHLALCFARPPINSRTLLYRAMATMFLGRKSRQEARNSADTARYIDKEDLQRTIESVRTCLRCAALVAVEHVTIYDEDGLVKKIFEGKSEWTIDMPFKDQQRLSKREARGTSGPQLVSDDMTTPFKLSQHLTKACSTEQDVTDVACDAASKEGTIRLKASLQSPLYGKQRLQHINGFHKNVDDADYTLTVNLLGPEDAKRAIAKAATAILHDRDRPKVIDVKAIDESLQAQKYPSEPDLLIIHGGSRGVQSLHGFPPWLVRLCEIFQDVNASPRQSITAVSIEAAIISFSQSEQRYGR